MQFITSLLNDFGAWLLSNKSEVALSIVATALVVFGEDINGIVRRALRPYGVFMRFLGFVALCVFGYGFITVYATKAFIEILILTKKMFIPFIVIGIFLILASFASRRRQI